MTDTYKTKNITVRQKIATGDDTYIVCGNSDYTVHWDLDNEWAEYAEKTMLVVLDSGEVYSIQFTGTEAALPALPNTRRCVIGLMAGDVRTTTGAMFACRPSIRDASGTPVEPPADLYAQLTAQLAGKISEPSQDGTAGQALVTDGKGGRSWATVQGGGSADAILYTEQELTDEQQAQARANIDAISSADVPEKLPNPYPLEITFAEADGDNYPGVTTYDGSYPRMIDIRSNFTEWRPTQPGYIKNNPFAGSGKTYLPTGANWTNEFSQSSILNFEIDGTKYYNVEGVQDGPMYMLKFTCGDYTIHLNRMNTTFSISPVLSADKWHLLKIGALPQINMEAEPETDMQIATKKYVDNHAAASGKDGITPTIGENGNWYLGDEDTGKPSRGATGAKGDTGPQGPAGKDGAGINWRGEWQDGTLYSKLDAVSYEGSGYIFTSDTSATGAVPGIDVEWQLMAQGGAGGTDISLALTGATIGQIAKISAVDDNGVPTAWEPVDMPSGGNSEMWELIKKVEISDEASTVKINADESGEPFELSQVKIYVQAYFAATSKGTITLNIHKNVAGSATTYNWPITASSGEISSLASSKYPACLAAHFCPTPYYINGNKLWGYTAWYRSQVLASTPSDQYISGDFGVTGTYGTRVLDAARCIQITGSAPFVAGTKIFIFGVRGTVS